MSFKQESFFIMNRKEAFTQSCNCNTGTMLYHTPVNCVSH